MQIAIYFDLYYLALQKLLGKNQASCVGQETAPSSQHKFLVTLPILSLFLALFLSKMLSLSLSLKCIFYFSPFILCLELQRRPFPSNTASNPRFEVLPLQWGREHLPPSLTKVDVILGSDVFYSVECIQAFFEMRGLWTPQYKMH